MKNSKKIKTELEEFTEKPQQKKIFDKHYQALSFSEALLMLMEKEAISVRALAQEIKSSPSLIQGIRSGEKKNITLNTLFEISAVFGATVQLNINGEIITLSK